MWLTVCARSHQQNQFSSWQQYGVMSYLHNDCVVGFSVGWHVRLHTGVEQVRGVF